MEVETVEEMMKRLPKGYSIINEGLYFSCAVNGNVVSGSPSIRTLLEMELAVLDVRAREKARKKLRKGKS